jgi:hypothetical protein
MKRILFIIISLVFVLYLCAIVHKNTSQSENIHYYLKHNYKNSEELFNKLPSVSNKNNEFFLWCCDCMLYYAKKCGMSYEEINIYLFVILQPYLILLFFVLFIGQTMKLHRLRYQLHMNRERL